MSNNFDMRNEHKRVIAVLAILDLPFRIQTDASKTRLTLADFSSNTTISISSKINPYEQALRFIQERIKHHDDVERNTKENNLNSLLNV